VDSGRGGKPADQGYWLSFLAVDRLDVDGRRVPLGIDYQYPTPAPPTCGARPAPVSFNPPGAAKASPDAIGKIFAIFNEQPLQGGQVPPRVFKSLYDGVIAFVEFDSNSVGEAREFHWIGIFKKASYCKSTQPTADFVHFHRLVAANYATSHGGPPGVEGFWGSWLTAERFQSQGRDVAPGIDREHNPTPLATASTIGRCTAPIARRGERGGLPHRSKAPTCGGPARRHAGALGQPADLTARRARPPPAPRLTVSR
jgi:hypothetical protein